MSFDIIKKTYTVYVYVYIYDVKYYVDNTMCNILKYKI